MTLPKPMTFNNIVENLCAKHTALMETDRETSALCYQAARLIYNLKLALADVGVQNLTIPPMEKKL